MMEKAGGLPALLDLVRRCPKVKQVTNRLRSL